MRTSPRFANLPIAAAAIAVLAGCSNASGASFTGSTPEQPSGVTGLREAKAGGALAFISDWNNHAVYIIGRNGSVTATLAVDGPGGLAVDAAHNLYVVDEAGSDVLVYAPPYTSASRTLADPGFKPNGVAVDGNGNVAVTSVTSNSGGPGSVAFYAKGSTNPATTILANGRFAGDYYCAFDAHGNLYLDSENGSGPFEAGEVVGGIAGKRVEPLTTHNLVKFPGGMQVTKSGLIAILDQGNGSTTPTIYAYNPPKRGSLGDPVTTTPLSSANDALAFAFQGRNERFVLTADTFSTLLGRKRVKSDHEDQIGQTQLFAYPAGGGEVQSVRLPLDAILVGVAVNPTESR